MEDIKQRLRDRAETRAEGIMMSAVRGRIEWEAADYIETLEHQIKELCGAIDECVETPVKSLLDRMKSAADSARHYVK